jgi:hypothetical protein
VKIEVVFKDMGARKMVPKHELPKSIPLHNQGLNYGTNICGLKDHVGEKGWSLN